jgi:hypothetical protein
MNTRTWIVTGCLLAAAPAAGAQGMVDAGVVSTSAQGAVNAGQVGAGAQVGSTSATADAGPLFKQVSSLLWVDVGFSLHGADGAPVLTGSGVLAADDTASIKLEHAKPYAPAVLVISDSVGPTPFKGGLLVPSPAVMQLILRTQADGTIELAFEWDVALQSGLDIYLQFVIKDSAATEGYAMSNALVLHTP